MRLIDVNTLALHEFFGDAIPPYAILSHTWETDEASFQEWQRQHPGQPDGAGNKQQAPPPPSPSRSEKAGFRKIRAACRLTRSRGLKWLWVDTNCINKDSSAELTEAINSMYAWYEAAEVCFAYLADVVHDPSSATLPESGAKALAASRWFTRGWTLQELLAPTEVLFLDGQWEPIGSRNSLAAEISVATGIRVPILRDAGFGSSSTTYRQAMSPLGACVAERMSWVARRRTTRVEDMAYCMLGLFDVNMPLLYGEGVKAFTRLQEEIIKRSTDHTIFAWAWSPAVPSRWKSVLAPSPAHFDVALTGTVRPMEPDQSSSSSGGNEVPMYAITNAGLSISLRLLYTRKTFLAALDAQRDDRRGNVLCLPLEGRWRGSHLHATRTVFPATPISVNVAALRPALRPLLITTHLDRPRLRELTVVTMPTMPQATSSDYPSTTVGGWGEMPSPATHYILSFDSEESRKWWQVSKTISSEPPDALLLDRNTVHLPVDKELTPEGEDVSIRGAIVHWRHMQQASSGPKESSPTPADIFLLIAHKTIPSRRLTLSYCQLFANFDRTLSMDATSPPSLRAAWMPMIWKQLGRQVRDATKDQRTNYYPELNTWVSMDVLPTSRTVGSEVGVLHIIEGGRDHKSPWSPDKGVFEGIFQLDLLKLTLDKQQEV